MILTPYIVSYIIDYCAELKLMFDFVYISYYTNENSSQGFNAVSAGEGKFRKFSLWIARKQEPGCHQTMAARFPSTCRSIIGFAP